MTIIAIVLVRNRFATVHDVKGIKANKLNCIIEDHKQDGFEVYPIYAEQKL